MAELSPLRRRMIEDMNDLGALVDEAAAED